ncbi:MAG: DUF5011 domain-containing protein [Gammaproteobacteria bacterium]|nr:MAG: DUF5011 domain-containing protein [Gammaproteobacteria bacterium]
MRRSSFAKKFSLAASFVLSTFNYSHSFAYELPENTLKWEVIPSAIRADGNDSFVIEVYSPQTVSTIQLNKMPTDINDGDYVKPKSGYFFTSIALKDDGTGADRIAGDSIYTAGPFVYDTSKAFPVDGFEGVEGIFNDAIGDLQVTFTDNQYTYSSNGIFVRVGLVRDDIENVETTELSDNIQASPYVINMVDDNYASERRMRKMYEYSSHQAGLDQTSELYSVLEDDFDQILIFSTTTLNDISQSPKTSIKGMHYNVRNDIEGIGLNIYDSTASYGSNGILQGISYFSHGRLDSDLVIHEITHQWEAFLDSPIEGVEITDGGGHWNSFVNWHSYYDWVENVDGTFTKKCRYSEGWRNPLDKKFLKYVMGYSYYTDITEDLRVVDRNDSAGDFMCDKTITKTIHNFTMEDIIAVNGIRTPGPENAQRDFKAAVVFSTANRKFNATEMTFASIYAQNIGTIVGDALFGSTWTTALPAFPDTTPPVITLNGAQEINVILDSEFVDPGAVAIDNVDGNISGQIITVGDVDTTTTGEYTITYNVSDSSGNAAEEVTRTVIVSEEPLCDEFTATNLEHENAGRAYSETKTEGQTCWGTFCYGGTEVTTWYASGSDENLGTNGSASVTLHEETQGVWKTGVCPGPDVTAPVITIAGDNPMTVFQSSNFTDPGATAEDNIDGDVTADIVVTGYVDTNTIGSYELVYTVSDAAGNEASEIRTVNVVAIPACQEFTSTLSSHESAGRAYSITETTGQTCWGTFCYGGTTTTTWYAEGSDENLGTNGSATVTLRTSANGYITGNCPTDPQPPVIESYEVAEHTYLRVVVTGTASDPDGDIDRVVLGLGAATGIYCEGTTSFTCTLDWDAYGFEVGAEVSLSVSAWDSREAVSNIETFLLTRPEKQDSVPPVISNIQQTREGTVEIVTVDITDVDGDLAGAFLYRIDDIGRVDCYNTSGSQYRCEMQLQGASYATMTWKVRAYDHAENVTDSSEFTVVWEEQASCFTAANSDHINAGRAELRYNILAYAIGSGDYLGMSGDTTSLEETSDDVWTKVTSCN